MRSFLKDLERDLKRHKWSTILGLVLLVVLVVIAVWLMWRLAIESFEWGFRY